MLKMPPQTPAALIQKADTNTSLQALKDVHKATHVAYCRYLAYVRVSLTEDSEKIRERKAQALKEYVECLKAEEQQISKIE